MDWGPLDEPLDRLRERTGAALARAGRIGDLGAHVPPDEIDEMRIIGSWLASHPHAAQLPLRPEPDRATLQAFVQSASALERKLDDDRLDLVGADAHV